MKEMLLYYIVGVNILTFLVYGIDKWRAKKGSWRISEATLLLLAVIGGSIGAWLGMKVWHHKTMHKKFKYGIPAILIIQIILIGYGNFTPNVSPSSDVQMEDTQRTITAEMAFEGVNNYCHKEYDWSVAKDNPDIMYLTMGEETDSTYQVVFRSYTGAFVHFYVNKTSGTTKMVEKVPSLNVEEDAGTINLFDYL
jgi:uncharacterized membrane protein YsdA (DUF1294 family)